MMDLRKVRLSDIVLTECLIHNSKKKKKKSDESIKKMINDGNNATANSLLLRLPEAASSTAQAHTSYLKLIIYNGRERAREHWWSG